jgi:hypothetical protein
MRVEMLILITAATSLSAQTPERSSPRPADSTLIGIVVTNAATHAPLENAELRLNDQTPLMKSDYVGGISFARPRQSEMRLRVTLAGFSSIDTTIAIGNLDWIQVVLALAPAAQPLPRATTVASAPAIEARLADFERRRLQGRGRFITPAQMTEATDKRLLDVLMRLPGLEAMAGSAGLLTLVHKGGPTSFVESNRRTYAVNVRGDTSAKQTSKGWRTNETNEQKPGYCEVAIFMDGMYVQSPDISMLRASGFAAVEYYTPSNVPPEFKRPGAQCGVMLLWSR